MGGGGGVVRRRRAGELAGCGGVFARGAGGRQCECHAWAQQSRVLITRGGCGLDDGGGAGGGTCQPDGEVSIIVGGCQAYVMVMLWRSLSVL